MLGIDGQPLVQEELEGVMINVEKKAMTLVLWLMTSRSLDQDDELAHAHGASLW